ncbi:hypothetical protein DPX16_13586 [Anabarilius grahami]|uniref:Uncharacterized protein n=1 Tax=Anabarilius grahami TaxID=495550 RepID=A0A3N0XRJ1_ANAGA|nr:hypothetical protein DPX16_13586 [Anabarilius grahami]
MTTVKSQLTHFLETWDNSKAPIHQSCISADAERARLKQEVDGLQAELKSLQVEVPNLRSYLDAAREQMLQLENQAEVPSKRYKENMQRLSQTAFTKKGKTTMLSNFEIVEENESFSPYRGTSTYVT